ncbi:MAG: hypothetical protein EXQ71_04960 [Acidimicrobiia bacterium]|nr:hypothetical protein [Acidimicrobiia bacterium]
MLAVANPDADLEGTLRDWRRFRRQKRTADIHWIDALYQAYTTAIVGLVIVLFASGAVGDDPLSASQTAGLLAHGPGWLGGLAAFAIALGLRSGSRGGPLALERTEVRHVLLAPVDRTTALRAPAVRQLRFVTFVGIVVGAIAGNLATNRLDGGRVAWIATGALAGLVLVALCVGSALLAGGTRLPRGVASLVGVVLIGLVIADGTGVIGFSATSTFGDLVLWPLRVDLAGLVPVVVAGVALLVGMRLLGRLSLEAAERRSTLVGQLRFAATLQDVRTVIVLRRQLAMELPRLRPWVGLAVNGTGRWPVFVRGLRGLMRWPAARVARLVLLAAVIGLCLRGIWSGTTPLVIVAGMALFIAGLDSVEPLAQEVDHPSRRDATPLEAGEIHLRHVPVAVLTQLAVAAIALAVAMVPGRAQLPLEAGAVAFVPLALGGLGGALVSVLASAPSVGGNWSLAPPEAQGMRLAFRTVWPPAIAILGVTPVFFAHRAQEQGLAPITGGVRIVPLVILVFGLICGWVRVRADIGTWWRSQMEMAHAKP